MSGSIGWTAAPIYESFANTRLGVYDNWFLRTTILKRILTGDAQIDAFDVEDVNREFDEFWSQCDLWYFNTYVRAQRYYNVHNTVHNYILQAIQALGISRRETTAVLKESFFRDAYLMFGITEQEIMSQDRESWAFTSIATKNRPMELMFHWMNPDRSPFKLKGAANWFRFTREYQEDPTPLPKHLQFHNSITHSSTSFLAAMLSLASQLTRTCDEGGLRIGVTEEHRDLVIALIEPLNGTEQSNFRIKTETFNPDALVEAESVQAEYLEVTVTDSRFQDMTRFDPDKMILTPQLMAYLQILIMEDYGGFSFYGNTPKARKFPRHFFDFLGAGTLMLQTSEFAMKLVSFKGRPLQDNAWVVSFEFLQLWEDAEGLTAEVEEETKHSLQERQAERVVEIREQAKMSTVGFPLERVDMSKYITPPDNTMTYVVVGACLFGAIYFLNR